MMMTKPSAFVAAGRPVRRGICLVVRAPGAARRHTTFPRRPDPGVLSESIPLFFIGRNESGLWVARDAEGRKGGIFLFKRSALRFAAKNSGAPGCATMFLSERLELDVDNQGNSLIGWVNAAMRRAVAHLPMHAAADASAVAAGQSQSTGERR